MFPKSNLPLLMAADALPAKAVEQVDQSAQGRIAVLPIRGPLTHHASEGFACYDHITAVAEVLLNSADVDILLLAIDSPGGEVSGCFGAAADLRRVADAAGKRLVAYAHQACSAAYAWASACETIYAAPASRVGSIGVIQPLEDHTVALAAQGIQVTLVTSGARKADGNPAEPHNPEMLAAVQGSVDGLAGMFFDIVSDDRGLPAKEIKGMQAQVFNGVEGKKMGLVDHVMTFGQCLAHLSATPQGTEESESMTTSDMIAQLKALAESGDEEAKALFGDEEKPEEDDAKATGDDKPKMAEDDEEEEEEAKATSDKVEASVPEGADAVAVMKIMQGQLAAITAERAAEKAAAKLATDTSALLATRPDFDATTLKGLRGASLATIKYACASLPKNSNPIIDAVAAIGVTPTTVGSTTGATASRELMVEMGTVNLVPTIREEGSSLIMGLTLEETK